MTPASVFAVAALGIAVVTALAKKSAAEAANTIVFTGKSGKTWRVTESVTNGHRVQSVSDGSRELFRFVTLPNGIPSLVSIDPAVASSALLEAALTDFGLSSTATPEA